MKTGCRGWTAGLTLSKLKTTQTNTSNAHSLVGSCLFEPCKSQRVKMRMVCSALWWQICTERISADGESLNTSTQSPSSYLYPSARHRRSRQSIPPPGSHLPDATWWPGWGRGAATPAWCTSSPWGWAGRRSGHWPPSRCSAAPESAEENQPITVIIQRTAPEDTM